MPNSTLPSLREIHPRDLKKSLQEVPTLPAIFEKLYKMTQDPEVSIDKLAEVISRDPSLATKILRLVNSAFYGRKEPVTSITRAVVTLGLRDVRKAVLAMTVFDHFQAQGSQDKCDLVAFWEHSVAVAGISKVLARQLGGQQPEEAFLVGLVHDIGKLVMRNQFPEDFRAVCDHLTEHPQTWHAAEKELLNVDHAMIGKILFRAWKLPARIVDGVQMHHAPSAMAGSPHLTALIHLSDFIAHELGMGSPHGAPMTECEPEAVEILGLSPAEAMAFESDFQQEMQQARDILQLNS